MNIPTNTPPVRIQAAGRITTCRSCGARIIWITTASGKAMPCDASPVYYKTYGVKKPRDRVVTLDGNVMSCQIVPETEENNGFGYVPHWGTCPNAAKFRKGAPKK